MYVDLNHRDYPINYSFARGIGSLSYVIASLALGRLLSSFSERTILYAGMISALIELCSVAILSRYVEETDPEEQAVDNGTSLFEFMLHNRSFMMIIG